MPPHSSYLRLDVRGGLNNQRECIVNGIVAAHELGLHLVLPSAHPVGQGNEKYDPHDAKFEGAGLNKRLPFEVCAAIDYGIAVAAPVYAGMRLSSFDVFASAERRAAGRQNATVMRPGGKMCGGT